MRYRQYLTSIVNHIKVSSAAGALLLVAGSAHAITVSGLNPNSSSYLATSGSFGDTYSGVAELSIVRSDLGYGVVEGCSGALLADGVSILTSAHCIADANGVERAMSAYVRFTTSTGTYSSQVVSFKVDPSYDGSATSPHDVAVLTLASPAPATVARYSLYAGDPSDQIMTLAGYGFGGAGANGYDAIEYPAGTLRVGENQYDPYAGTDDLMFDFDDGPTAQADEAFIAPGDAGGPSFIDGKIAGVHSYAERIVYPNGSSPDIDNVLDSSFGEVAADSSVTYNLAFIQSAMLLAPEPGLMILVGVALVAIALTGEKRKRR